MLSTKESGAPACVDNAGNEIPNAEMSRFKVTRPRAEKNNFPLCFLLPPCFPRVLRVFAVSLTLFLVALAHAAPAHAATWYVDIDNSNPTKDGTTWTTAFTDIQSAVDAASTGGGGDVWVAEGTYTAITDPVVRMGANVSLYGGFIGIPPAGWGTGNETSLAQRDFDAHSTVIDGESAHRCVIGANGGGLDGFTLTHGNGAANGDLSWGGYGGAVQCVNASFTIKNCSFLGNSGSGAEAVFFGGNMTDYSKPSDRCLTMEHCSVGSSSDYSTVGIVYVLAGACAISDCVFQTGQPVRNGLLLSNVSGTVQRCRLQSLSISATPPSDGAGLSIETCIIGSMLPDASLQNRRAIFISDASPRIINCTVYFPGGSPIRCGTNYPDAPQHPGPIIRNTIAWGDSPGIDNKNTDCTVEYSCVSGGFPGTGNIANAPVFENEAEGMFSLTAGSPCIDAGTLEGAPSMDFDGTARPRGKGIDIGASEMPPVRYVDADSTAVTPSGTTWATAFRDIQSAVDAAFADGGGQVWVAEGAYTATTDPVVTMKENVLLYGGFSRSETYSSQRNWAIHPSIIDGQGARRCVVGANNARLDGFMVQNGQANYGGGMKNIYASPAIANCVFYANKVDIYGGGIYNNYSSPVIQNCIFTHNAARCGAGIANETLCGTQIINCVFQNNAAQEYGGGVALGNGSVGVVNCTFTANTAVNGGSIQNGSSSSSIKNCILWGDSNAELFDDGASGQVSFCCIQGGRGGGSNFSSDPLFMDATLGNLRLRSSSPCIDAGSITGAPVEDIVGTVRPQGANVDIGAYEFFFNQDADRDGLPDVDEAGQGCDPGVADAALYATLPPSASMGMSLQAVPIALGGTLSSPYVNAVSISTDNGVTWSMTATIDSAALSWMCLWSPTVAGRYDIKLHARNVFGGYTETGPFTIYYRPNYPSVWLNTNPVMADRGLIDVTGVAFGTDTFGLQEWVLDYRPGTDPTSDVGRVELVRSSTPIGKDSGGGALYSGWDLDALSDGAYTLKLSATDASGDITSTTYRTILVDHGTTPAAAPSAIAISGAVLSNLIADGGTVNVTGTAEAGTYLYDAAVVDETGSTLKNVTKALTLHYSGSLRGSFTLPTGMTTKAIALKLQVWRKQLGVVPATSIISNPATSNSLAVDNAGPTVTIAFPKPAAILPRSLVIISGLAEDVGAAAGASAAGLTTVEYSTDNSTWTAATGTDTWSWNWTPPADGAYTLYVRATDKLGNIATASVAVTVNNAYPSTYITSPTQGQVVHEGESVQVIGTASDTSDFNYYRLQYAPGVSPMSGYLNITGQMFTPVSNGLLGTWNTTGLDEGMYTLRLFAMDQAGNFVRFDMQVNVLSRLSFAGIPDATLQEDGTLDDFAHLPSYCSALSGSPENFTYTITGNTSPQCGVSIDASKNLDIHPDANWHGTSTVTVHVTDGALSNDDVFTITATAVNDVPTTPGVALTPAHPAESDNLVCTVTTSSTDPDTVTDGQVVRYTYRWYMSTTGTSFGAPVRETLNTTVMSDTLPATQTQSGQYWKCEVTATDGQATSGACVVNARVLLGTTATLTLSAVSARIGQPITAYADVSPSSGRVVRFEYRHPSEATAAGFVNGTYQSGNRYSATLYLPAVGTWAVDAVVDATDTAQSVISASASVSVAQGTTATVLSSQESAIKPGDSVHLFGTLGTNPPLPTDLGDQLLTGQTVEIEATWSGVSQTFAATVSNYFGHFEQIFTPSSDKEGLWTFRARYVGDDNLAANDWSSSIQVNVQSTAGYALLIVGQVNGQSGLDDHRLTAQHVYDNLIATGFDESNIVIFDPGYAKAIGGTHEPLSKARIQQRIETWASAAMKNDPAPLYIVFVNHGSPGAFHIYPDAITPGELNAWLGAYANNLSGNARALSQPVIVVDGSCYSGSFLSPLARPTATLPRRVMIASADAAEESYKGPLESGNTRDGEMFVSQLFGQLALGNSLKISFDHAAETLRTYTENSTGNGGRSIEDYGDLAAQHPLLDDNGDGIGTDYLLATPPDGQDGYIASQVYLGFGPQQNTALLAFGEVSAPIRLTPGGTEAPALYANLDEGEPAVLWVEVKPPNFAADQSTSTEQKQLDAFTRIPPDKTKSLNRHTWSATRMAQANFSAVGQYEILYFGANARGELTPMARGFVYRPPLGTAIPPEPFDLLSPAADETVTRNALFYWQSTSDPDHTEVTYSLQLVPIDWPGNTGGSTPYPVVRIDGLTSSYYVFPDPGVVATPRDLVDGVTYDWRVFAYDAHGNHAESTTHRNVTVDSRWNPDVGSSTIQIRVVDENGSLVTNAIVTRQGSTFPLPGANGIYSAIGLPTGQTYHFTIGTGDGTLSIPLAVYAANGAVFLSRVVTLSTRYSLTVTLAPMAAIQAGARWQIDGDSVWHTSGETVSGLTIGQHTVAVSPLARWVSPPSRTISITAGDPSANLALTYAPRAYRDFSDINGDTLIDVMDVQLTINAALRLDIGSLNADINGDSNVDIMDVQLCINAALGVV